MSALRVVAIVALVGTGVWTVIALRRVILAVVVLAVRLVWVIVQTVARTSTLARRGGRWLRRRTAHVVAVAAALWSKPASLWRERSERTRRIGHRVLAPIKLVTTPIRAVLRGTYTRLSGIERFVGGSDPVRAALAGPAVGRFAPPLRTAYAERLDAMALSFVIGENRGREVAEQKHRLRQFLLDREADVDAAVEAARLQATALVSASEGLIDAVGGLIVPCCEQAMVRFLAVEDTDGPPLFAAGQLLLHRVFLNPASPAGISDWYAERAAREATKAFLQILERNVGTGQQIDRFAPAYHDAPAGTDRASDAIMLATAIGPHVAWVTPHVLDELLRHRSQLGRQNPWGQALPARPKKKAVADLDHEPNPIPASVDRRARLILEAMRHYPVVSGLIRDCPYATDLTDHGVRAPADAGEPPTGSRRLRPLRDGVTYVYTRAAEFDPARRGSKGSRILAFDPDRFEPSRPMAERPPTMSFGHGLHECLGQDIALRLMVAILDPLLSQERVRRDPTRRGLLQHRLRSYSPLKSSGEWRFPTRLYVRFEAGIRA